MHEIEEFKPKLKYKLYLPSSSSPKSCAQCKRLTNFAIFGSFRYLAYLDSKAVQNANRGFGNPQHAHKITELMRGTLVEAARLVVRHHYQNPTQDPILAERRRRTYSWLNSIFGDALVTAFCNLHASGSGRRLPLPKDAAGKLKIRSIGKVAAVGNGIGGSGGGAASSKAGYSSSSANRLQAESSLPFDIFEPMDTSVSPEKQPGGGGGDPCPPPKRVSERARAAFDFPTAAYTVTPICARAIPIAARGLSPRTRAELRRRPFQTAAISMAAKDSSKRGKRPSCIVVGKRGGDMSEAKRRRKQLDMRPRSLLSLT